MKWLLPVLSIAVLVQPVWAATATYSIDMILPLTGPAAFAGHAQEQAARVYEAVARLQSTETPQRR